MDRYRYLIYSQKSLVSLSVIQVACATICVVCGFIDASFRKDTPLSSTRTPLWGGLLMACPGVLGLCASQKKHSTLLSAMVAAAGLSCVSTVFIYMYSCSTLSYGEDDEDVFYHHHHHKVNFVLHQMVKGANATILLACTVGLFLSGVIAYLGCRGLPLCACYDSRTGLETLVPQLDPADTEMVCTWQAGGDDRLFNSPTHSSDGSAPDKGESPPVLPSYSRMT